MDAKDWSARQHEQHGMLFRNRAAKNGRRMAAAATSGVTKIIDSHG
jgi:apolipoprotein N-acyltransferase